VGDKRQRTGDCLTIGMHDGDPWARPGTKGGGYIKWPVEPMVLLGARFRNGRLQAGISQRALAERAGVSQSAVSRLERGLSTGMSAERIIRIAEVIPDFPLGFCPHPNHGCAYPPDPRARPSSAWLRQ